MNSPQRARSPAGLQVQVQPDGCCAHLGHADPAGTRLHPELVRRREHDALERRLETLGQAPPELLPHVDDGPAQSRPMEQSRLGRAVGLETAVIVEVIARQVGEDRGVEAHAGDAILVERVRGHLEAHRGCARVARLGEATLQAHRVGGRQTRVAQGARPAEAEGSEVGTAVPDEVRGLREQVGARRLAVGPRDPDDLQFLGRTPEEAVRQLARTHAEPGDLDLADVRGHRRCLHARCGLPQHGGRAALDRTRRMGEPVRGAALAGQERRARRHRPAVQRQVRDHDVAWRSRDPAKQIGERRTVSRSARVLRKGAHAGVLTAAHHGSCACTSVVAGMRCRSSGGSASSRSAPDITFENTGAATSPP